MINYKDIKLNFLDNKIVIEENIDLYVMIDWETPIMKKHADIVCQNGGDILEIGFGMGIFSNFVNSYNNINTHTIVEIHPQIIEKVKEWMKDKNNVILIEGDWYEMQDEIKKRKYDGIFIDTFLDKNEKKIKYLLPHIIKDGTIFSYFSPRMGGQMGYNNLEKYDYVKIRPYNKKNFYKNDKALIPWIKF